MHETNDLLKKKKKKRTSRHHLPSCDHCHPWNRNETRDVTVYSLVDECKFEPFQFCPAQKVNGFHPLFPKQCQTNECGKSSRINVDFSLPYLVWLMFSSSGNRQQGYIVLPMVIYSAANVMCETLGTHSHHTTNIYSPFVGFRFIINFTEFAISPY